jgi:predicted Fe-Mo cluster-binding NifX family protein
MGMDKLRIVFATDDGETFIERHFGDAGYFDLYEISPEEARFIKRFENTVSQQDAHSADDRKASGIAGLFKRDGVHVLVSKKFGANINRMKTKFVCVLMNEQKIPDSLKTIQHHYKRIVAEWHEGESRHFLNLKR